MADPYAGVLDAVQDHMADQSGVQAFLGVSTKAEALDLIYKYEYPIGDVEGNFILLDRGENWQSTLTRINTPTPFAKDGNIVMYTHQPLASSGQPEETPSLMGPTWQLVGEMIQSIEESPRIIFDPAAIILKTIELTQWWRPTQDDAETEGDKLECVFTLGYTTGA